MPLVALLLLACSRSPSPAPVAQVGAGAPVGWLWVTDSSGPFEAVFPRVPTEVATLEALTGADGAPIRSLRLEALLGQGAVVLHRTPEPPGAVASRGGPGPFSELVGRNFTKALGAQLAQPRSWAGMSGGWTSKIKVGALEGEVRIAVDGDVLYVLQALGLPPEATQSFLDAVQPLDEVRPVRVELPAGREVECPSRCGPLGEERILVGAARVLLSGAHGQLDRQRFEALAVPIGEHDPALIVDALRLRALSRGSELRGEQPVDGGVELRFGAGRGAAVARIVERDGAVMAVQVIAPYGTMPAWAERFLDSAR